MGGKTPLTQRLTAWTEVRAVGGGAAGLDNLALRDAARDLQVSFSDICRARDALLARAALDNETSGLSFRAELAEAQATGAFHARRDATAGPLTARFSGELTALPGVTPPAAHEVEGPPALLEGLVDERTGAAAWRRPWERLGPAEQRAAKALGFGPITWDAALDGSLEVLPSSMKTLFVELPVQQREAARQLGFEPESWDVSVGARKDILDTPDILDTFSRVLESDGLIGETAVHEELLPAARDWLAETPSEKRALLYLLDFHPHRFTHDARRALRDDVLRHTLRDQIAAGFTRLEHGSDRVVNDASGLVPTIVARVVAARTAEDVRRAIGLARVLGTRVSIAGRRHSEGGQSVSAGSVNVDMRGMNHMELLDNGNLRVEAGATWAQVQAALAEEGRAVRVMQSSNIFTVGGSIGVNCHGRTPGEPPLVNTIESMKVMTADGRVLTCSRDGNADLFRHVVGGYGLFGVVLEVELRTKPNPPCRLDVELVSEDDYLQVLDAAAADPDVELAWGRLSPTLSGEILFHRVKRVDEGALQGEGTGVGIESESAAALAKAVLHLSKIGPFALEARWALQTRARLGEDARVRTLTDYSSPSVEMLSPYWFHEGKKTDILHEYYLPRSQVQLFLDGLRELQEQRGMHTLNCTVRDVGEDAESALPYAREDSVAFVLYYNQDITPEADAQHAAFTRELIDLVLDCGGTFYLPYQTHYSDAQLRRGYPSIDEFFEKKRELDPGGVFSNRWFERYAGGGGQPDAA